MVIYNIFAACTVPLGHKYCFPTGNKFSYIRAFWHCTNSIVKFIAHFTHAHTFTHTFTHAHTFTHTSHMHAHTTHTLTRAQVKSWCVTTESWGGRYKYCTQCLYLQMGSQLDCDHVTTFWLPGLFGIQAFKQSTSKFDFFCLFVVFVIYLLFFRFVYLYLWCT